MPITTRIKGVFCISLDFEKFWGVRDVCDYQEIEERFKKIEPIVGKMLGLFERYEIHATWATVGLLGYDCRSDLYKKNADKKIPYLDQKFSPFPISGARYDPIPFEILSARGEMERILKTPHQELASHTFAHFYTCEDGQSETDFNADLIEMTHLSTDLNYPFRSIVFPRNQVNPKYLHLLSKQGYVAYRGNQENADWVSSAYRAETKKQKIRRVLDAYFKISKTRSRAITDLVEEGGLINIPASRFLRPNHGNSFLEKRKLKRVKDEMNAAAIQGLLYHLWWHPHNFTFQPEKSLIQLEEILKHYKFLHEKYEFRSLTMREIATYVKH